MITQLPDNLDRNSCAALDARDPIAAFRDRFLHDGTTIYLDGNSMGRLPKAAVPRLREMAEHEWGTILVRGWTESGWMESPLRVGDRIGELVGASRGEVLVADTTSVGLFRLMTSVVRARPQRRVIVTERSNFPTDLYIAAGVAELLGCEVRAVDRSELGDALDGDTALLILTEVDFRTGARHDMGALTEAAHAAGALVLWDLSHSAGAVEIRLNHHRRRPGRRLHLQVPQWRPRITGVPVRRQGAAGGAAQSHPGMARPRQSVPLRLRVSPCVGDTRLDERITPGARDRCPRHRHRHPARGRTPRIGEKAAMLTEVFIRLAHSRLDALGFDVATPGSSERRGAQVSLRHADGLAIVRAVADRGVIGDFRPPDMCRFGLAPLYTRFVDLWDAVERIAEVVENGMSRLPKYREEVAIP